MDRLLNKNNRNDLYLSPWQGYDINNKSMFANITKTDAETMALNLMSFVRAVSQYYKPKNDIQFANYSDYIMRNFGIPAVNLEEIQTIIGREPGGNLSPSDIQSENSYRLSRNEYKMNETKFLANIDEYEKLNLRYGHVTKSCNIRKEILEWCVKLANETKGAA